MNYTKATVEELKERLKSVKQYIDGLYEELDLMPEMTFLGRLSVKASIRKAKQVRDSILNELKSREYDDDNNW